MQKNITVWLEPYWNIRLYGTKKVNIVEKQDGVVNKMERDIESNIAERYPGIKKVDVTVRTYEPIPIVDHSNQPDDVRFRYSKIGFRVDLKFCDFMNADDVRKNVLEIGKNYDITKITELVELSTVAKVLKVRNTNDDTVEYKDGEDEKGRRGEIDVR